MSFKSYIVKASVDGEEQMLYIEAENKDAATSVALNDFKMEPKSLLPLGNNKYPKSISIISVDEF